MQERLLEKITFQVDIVNYTHPPSPNIKCIHSLDRICTEDCIKISEVFLRPVLLLKILSPTVRHYVIIVLCHLIPLCSFFPLLMYSVTKYLIIKLRLLFLCVTFRWTSNLILDIKNNTQVFVFVLFCFAMNKFICLSWR